jgi:hypothetical protein
MLWFPVLIATDYLRSGSVREWHNSAGVPGYFLADGPRSRLFGCASKKLFWLRTISVSCCQIGRLLRLNRIGTPPHSGFRQLCRLRLFAIA